MVAGGARMRCADCGHRWVPAPDPTDDQALPVPEPVFENVVAAPSAAEEHDQPVSPRTTWLRNLVAVVAGLVLAIAAGALWARGSDPLRLPLIGPYLAVLRPAPSTLHVDARGLVTGLPNGQNLLEITGTVSNRGKTPEILHGIDARLWGPAGTARRWRINIPSTSIAAGQTLAFSGTATGFPADAKTLSLTPVG